MEPKQLSQELRKGQNPDLSRRRFIVGLSFLGATMAEAVSMYQVGIIDHLPDVPIPGIDSNKVDASDYAYRNFDTPDGSMMLANYSMISQSTVSHGAGVNQCFISSGFVHAAQTSSREISTIRSNTRLIWGQVDA